MKKGVGSGQRSSIFLDFGSGTGRAAACRDQNRSKVGSREGCAPINMGRVCAWVAHACADRQCWGRGTLHRWVRRVRPLRLNCIEQAKEEEQG